MQPISGFTKPVFVVYDAKAEIYLTPFMMRSKGEAVRAFMDIANNKETAIGLHPEDYILYYIADYDELKGFYENRTPECIGKAIEYVARPRTEVSNA